MSVATLRGLPMVAPATLMLTPDSAPPVLSRTTPDSWWAGCADAVTASASKQQAQARVNSALGM